jgi:hypothetical protein
MTDLSELERRLFESAERMGLVLTGDWRTTEAGAAQLLGLSVRTLQRLREDGGGPTHWALGCGDGSRLSYRLADLAHWIELNRPTNTTGDDRTRHETTPVPRTRRRRRRA